MVRSITISTITLVAGCTMLAGAPDPYYPSAREWETISPRDAGWSEEALEGALVFAGENLSTGVVMLKEGRIVAERYWPLPNLSGSRLAAAASRLVYEPSDEGYPSEDVASLQKSLVAALVAIARQRGILTYDDPIAEYLGDEWAHVSAAQARAITVRHVMTMTSGLNEQLEFVAPPGTSWLYNTNAYQNLLRLLVAATGMDANQLTRAWITDPIGMRDTRWVVREWAEQPGAAPMMGLVSTPRDLARFGILILNEGRWRAEQLIEKELVRELVTPSQELNRSYGLLWWLNGEGGHTTPAGEAGEGRRIEAAPADLLTAAGALNRYLHVLPGERAIIVRTGLVNPRGAGDAFGDEWWEYLARIY